MYRAVVSNSVGGVADVQRRLPAANAPRAGIGWIVYWWWREAWFYGNSKTRHWSVMVEENE